MKRLKVITVIGTRPEIIKLSQVIAVLDRVSDHVLVHTGQNYDYELNQLFFTELGVRKPDHFLSTPAKTLARTIGNIITNVDEVLEAESPDAVLILGDTNSALSAIAAKRRRIPVFHMEAGNRCFDERVPEEINRRIVDHISDINMTYTEHARRNLLAEGLPADRVIKTGSPQREILDAHRDSIAASDILSRLSLCEGDFFVASIHREENVDDPVRLEKLMAALGDVANRYEKPMVLSLHPRTRKRVKDAGLELNERVQSLAPLGFFDYVHLQQTSCCAISDSGTITEESALLGFPAVTIRGAHERPEGTEEGVLVMSGVEGGELVAAVETVLLQTTAFGIPRVPSDYDVPQLSWKVAKIIQSYVSYVKRRVWYEIDSSGRS